MKKRMMKRSVALVMAALMSAGGTFSAQSQVRAADSVALLSESADVPVPYGIYLQNGSSRISDIGKGWIAVNGTTVAHKIVAEISVDVIVERRIDGVWKRYESWTETKYNKAIVSSGKQFPVQKGYYYRVRSVHYANSDVSSSVTGGVLID